jgi:signal transduction histidine kinase
MKEVIINLLTNSMKYSCQGTTTDVELIESEDQIIIHVSDKRIGIPEVEKEHIFESFWRGSNIDNIHGTGLGLTLFRKFVRLYGGDITFESKINEGTTFLVSLSQI